MRRLIAALAVCAMTTTAAFAQASVAGTVQTRMNVAQGNLSDDDADLEMGGLVGTAWLQLSGANADGTLGGTWRLRNQDIVRTGSLNPAGDPVSGAWFHRAFVWWRPIQQMRVWLGIDDDGMFGTDALAGHDFHQGDNDYMFNHDWSFWRRVFPGTFTGFGLALSFSDFGVDGLALNLVLPTGSRGHPGATAAAIVEARSIQQMLAGFRLHGTYAIPGMGTVQFSYAAPGGIMNIWSSQWGDLREYSPEWGDARNFGQLGLSFLMTGLDFGNLILGGSIIIPDGDHYADAHIGAAVHVANIADLMGLRFRVGMQIQGGDDTLDPLMTMNLMPVVPLGPGSLMFDFGLTARFHEDFDSDLHLGWSVKPVYRLPLSSGSFQVGLHLHSGVQMGGQAHNLVTNSDVHINIPMALTFSF